MPTYKNRPPMDPDTPVWRYLSLNAVIATVRDRQLRFTRVDTFPDPFEGSVPKQTIDEQVVLFGGAYHMRMAYASVAAHYPSGAAQAQRILRRARGALAEGRRRAFRCAHQQVAD